MMTQQCSLSLLPLVFLILGSLVSGENVTASGENVSVENVSAGSADLECSPINFTEGVQPRQTSVSVVEGTHIKINFQAPIPSDDNHIDFFSTTQNIVLRIKFMKNSVEDQTGNQQDMKMQLTSMRKKGGITETVGEILDPKINDVEENATMTLDIIVTKDHYSIKISYPRKMTNQTRRSGPDRASSITRKEIERPHYLLFQTIEYILLGDFKELEMQICNVAQSVCDAVCVTCPSGSRVEYKKADDQQVLSYHNSTAMCFECTAGRYTDEENLESCHSCNPGSYTSQNAGTGCQKCPRGTSSSAGEKCQNCEEGSYSSEPGASNCTICPPGWITDKEVRATKCTECSIGQYSGPPPATSCQTCPSGTVTPNSGAAECSHCPFGALNKTHCACDAGFYRASPSECEPCPAGWYTPRPEMLSCVECGAGEVIGSKCKCSVGSSLVGDTCVRGDCPPGYRLNTTGSCITCPAGSISTSLNSDTCTPCPPGSYQADPGSTTCTPCSPGSHAAARGATTCSRCKTPTYQPDEGKPTCLVCRGTVMPDNTCQVDVFKCTARTEEYANVGEIAWPAAEGGDQVRAACPYGGGEAARACINDVWQDPDLSACHSQMTEQISAALVNAPKDPEGVTAALESIISKNIKSFGPKDIQDVTNILDETELTNSRVADKMLGSVIGMVEYEDSLESVVSTSDKDKVVSLIERGISFLVQQGETDDISKYNTKDVSVSINGNGSVFTQTDKKQEVAISSSSTFSTIVYRTSKLFTVDKATDMLSSDVMSVVMHGAGDKSDPDFVVDMQLEVASKGTPECRWYDTVGRRWSTVGCYITERGNGSLNCQCDHLTSFAAFTSLSEVSAEHRQAQSMITTWLFILSIVTCLITLAVYLPVRSLRSKMIIKVEMMEVTALILANLTFLVLARVQHQTRICAGLVFTLQYFYLATIAWSFVAAWTFYRQIVNAIHTYGKTYQHSFLLSCLTCWTLPVAFPAFAYIYSQKHGIAYVEGIEGTFGCWMAETWKTYTFILPILITVSINTVLGLRVIYVMLRASSNKKVDSWELHKRHIKSVISLLTLFGTSFLLSLFTYGPHAIVFQYLFICFTCSQGFFVFILFVPLRPELHNEWRTYLSRFSTRVSSPKTSRTDSTGIFTTRKLSRMNSVFTSRKENSSPEDMRSLNINNGAIRE